MAEKLEEAFIEELGLLSGFIPRTSKQAQRATSSAEAKTQSLIRFVPSQEKFKVFRLHEEPPLYASRSYSKMADRGLDIVSVEVKDVRFPTSLELHGSDAMHPEPDYSCAYVVITTEDGRKGYGLTFTLGRGTEIVVQAVHSLSHLIVGKNARQIFFNFARTWRDLTSESQLRWIGPEKGVIHLATAAVVNSLWDLWARLENKPLWKLLCDLEPQVLVSTIDFRYVTDLITAEECVEMLEKSKELKEVREKELKGKGYPAYTTQIGWLGYSEEKMKSLCREFLRKGFSAFKIKVGRRLEEDVERCRLVRRLIGPRNLLMVDANQMWEVKEAIEWMKNLQEFHPYWVEEPTSPDDVLGHATVSQALNPSGIRVASGEMCANRVMFKQFLQAKAIQICQIDSARLGGVNEILSVYFMAKKLQVPVCPHAGGVGLCEMVRHLQIFDYVCLTGTTEGRMIEYVDREHDHFEDPAIITRGKYRVPEAPGYSSKLKEESLKNFEFPYGREWRRILAGLPLTRPADSEPII